MREGLRALAARPELRRLALFVVVGLVNTGFGYGVYAVLVLAGLIPHVALACSFTLGVIWNYFTHARFVFHAKGFRRLPLYAACYVGLYLLNVSALHLLLDAGLPPLLAQAVLTPVAAVLAFLLVSLVLTGRVPFFSAEK